MLVGSTQSFYRSLRVMRGAVWGGVCVVVLGGGWWMSGWLLLPGVPDDSSTAEACVRFIAHEKGLPRLRGERRERYLAWQIKRLLGDEQFCAAFVSRLRRASPDERSAVDDHIIGAFKPSVMRDVRSFVNSEGEERATLLDERIVAYNRMRVALGDVRGGIGGLSGLAPGNAMAMAQRLMDLTTERERNEAAVYAAALKLRIDEINADPELRAEFEKRIADG